MTALLTIEVIGVALLAWGCVFKLVPDYALSHNRYKLWRLRDVLADEIRHGAFSDAGQPRAVLRVIERSIESLSDLSALNLVLFRATKGNSIRVAPP